MITIRKWLDEENFDWIEGKIVLHKIKGNYPGWCQHSTLSREVIDNQHPILDLEFSTLYGGPECPCIFARDSKAVYFPSQYDGSTCLEKVYIDHTNYLMDDSATPYPGG